jgi:hypothetical protein
MTLGAAVINSSAHAQRPQSSQPARGATVLRGAHSVLVVEGYWQDGMFLADLRDMVCSTLRVRVIVRSKSRAAAQEVL